MTGEGISDSSEFKKIRFRRSSQGVPGHFGTVMFQAQAQPGALEPGMPCDENPFPGKHVLLPDRPGGITALPPPFETQPIAMGIHALPIPVVFVDHQLPIGSTAFERLTLEYA